MSRAVSRRSEDGNSRRLPIDASSRLRAAATFGQKYDPATVKAGEEARSASNPERTQPCGPVARIVDFLPESQDRPYTRVRS